MRARAAFLSPMQGSLQPAEATEEQGLSKSAAHQIQYLVYSWRRRSYLTRPECFHPSSMTERMVHLTLPAVDFLCKLIV